VLREHGGKVIPDAELFLFYRMPTGSRGLRYKAEFDQATESPARIVEKFRAYVSMAAELRKVDPEAALFRVLFIATTEARIRSIRRGVITHLGPSKLMLLTHEQRYSLDRPDSILGAIWQRVSGEEPLKLLP
jgi:hypothetical protein